MQTAVFHYHAKQTGLAPHPAEAGAVAGPASDADAASEKPDNCGPTRGRAWVFRRIHAMDDSSINTGWLVSGSDILTPGEAGWGLVAGMPLATLLMGVFASVVQHQWVSWPRLSVRLAETAHAPALSFAHGQRPVHAPTRTADHGSHYALEKLAHPHNSGSRGSVSLVAPPAQLGSVVSRLRQFALQRLDSAPKFSHFPCGRRKPVA